MAVSESLVVEMVMVSCALSSSLPEATTEHFLTLTSTLLHLSTSPELREDGESSGERRVGLPDASNVFPPGFDFFNFSDPLSQRLATFSLS